MNNNNDLVGENAGVSGRNPNSKARDPNFIDPEKQRKLLWIEKADWRKTIPFVVFAMVLYYMRK